MEIEVKLMGMLKERTPDGGRLSLPLSATIADALEALAIDAPPSYNFSVNGQLERNRARSLCDGDQLTVLPPVGGG